MPHQAFVRLGKEAWPRWAGRESSRGRISVYALADGGIHANTKETVYFIK